MEYSRLGNLEFFVEEAKDDKGNRICSDGRMPERIAKKMLTDVSHCM